MHNQLTKFDSQQVSHDKYSNNLVCKYARRFLIFIAAILLTACGGGGGENDGSSGGG